VCVGALSVLVRLAIGACVGVHGRFLGHAREVLDEMHMRR
jgi:hypothetical protein